MFCFFCLGAKQVQDKGRRKLDFCNERKKPLSGCKVFLDISLKTTVSEITKRIEALGGVSIQFPKKHQLHYGISNDNIFAYI